MSSITRVLTILFFFFVSSILSFADPVTFQQAIQLALSHSPTLAIATNDQVKAYEGYLETRNGYLPTLYFGSGLAKTWGFPLSIEGSAPSIFNVNYQSYLINFAQRDYMRSAKSAWSAANRSREDLRKDVILDVASTYLELEKVRNQIGSADTERNEANKLVIIVNQRVRAGLATQLDLTRARLVAARLTMRMANLTGTVDVLRDRLAQQTGLPARSIETIAESIPRFPETNPEEDLSKKAVSNSGAIAVAQDRAAAAAFLARGEHKTFLPEVDLVATYGLFTRYNNYDLYFNRFQNNNAAAGVNIRFPFLNYVARAHAAQADADAIKAKKQVEITRDQVSSETLRLQHQVAQLAAAQDVAQLEYELAEGEARAVRVKTEAAGGTGSAAAPGPQGAPLTASPSDLVNAELDAQEKYSSYLDSSFEYDKARLQLLRQTGELEAWALARK
jgi:outer membrane protein TolC